MNICEPDRLPGVIHGWDEGDAEDSRRGPSLVHVDTTQASVEDMEDFDDDDFDDEFDDDFEEEWEEDFETEDDEFADVDEDGDFFGEEE